MEAKITNTVIFLAILCVPIFEAKSRREILNSYLETNEVQTKSCARIMEHVYTDHVIATNPPDLTGEWTSERCEVRPGAEFILRKYIFLEKLQFELHQFFYTDSDCTKPSYSVVAKGRLYIGEESWLVPGALDSEYSLSLVSVMPYTDMAASVLSDKLQRSCPALADIDMKPFEVYSVSQFLVEDEFDGDSDVLIDRDCNAALDLVFHELQLLRMEVRKKGLEIRKMLYLGDIHTDKEQKQYYRPTSYQDPLYFKGTSGCHACKRILSSIRQKPPTLYRKTPTSDIINGEWFSTKCEVRPVGQFLTRHLIFSDDGHWEGYYHHFADQRCQRPLFTVYAKGDYTGKTPSSDILDASYYNMKVTNMEITARDKRIVNLLNEDLGNEDQRCGLLGSWELGKTQDVTATKGCAMLSLKVPIEDDELIKLEKQHHHTLLFLGQLPSKTETKQLSTSFQPPLLKCADTNTLELTLREDTIGINIEPHLGATSGSAAFWGVTPAIPSLTLSLISFLLCHYFTYSVL